jgi:erythronate-4-phosphate dehydrogenase
MLAYEQLATLDNAKLIINMARGGVVNQSDLKNVKYPPNNLIFDVWENEPNIDILFAQSLFFATPHIAGHSYEGKLRGTLNMLEVLEIYLSRKIDKTRVLNGINNSQKHHLSELSFENLFELLDSNIKIVGTSEEFKNSLESFEETNFNKIRKNYRKHNESLSEKSFE